MTSHIATKGSMRENLFPLPLLAGGTVLMMAGAANAETPPEDPAVAQGMERVVIRAPMTQDLIGLAATSSEGLITLQELQWRPVYRVGQMLEAVPGLVVTSHSGDGKANQYLMRGFNLDHGTDLATYVDGMPVNEPTHAHGQGYTDLNFAIPELVGMVDFTKGPYFAREGDFSSVGANRIRLRDTVENEMALTAGTQGDRRVYAGGTVRTEAGRLVAAAEIVRLDGPWDNADDVHKYNAVLRYSEGSFAEGYAVTAMAYRNRWNATTDQPARAVTEGLIGRFGSLDPSDGGRARRYSLSGRYAISRNDWRLNMSAYVIHSSLTLWNDFTHLLDDPVHGDQHGQNDRRNTTGGEASLSHAGLLRGRPSVTTVGLQTRNDAIDVDLQHTMRRRVLTVERADHVLENSIAAYADNTTNWTPWFRTVIGVREDGYRTRDTDLVLPANSATQQEALFQPKVNLVFSPFAATEFYVSAGRGFHSNDARSGLDESDRAYVRPPLLVKSRSSEIGMRSTSIPGWDLSTTLFWIDFDSELVYNGDAGATEAGRPSRREGVEMNAQYRPVSWLAFSANVAAARARYRDGDPATRYIEDSPDLVASASVLIENCGPWSGAFTFRRLGAHPLTNDNSVRSPGYSEWNGSIAYRFARTLKLRLELFNVFDARSNAADYYYASRLPGEPVGGLYGLHSHPLEPRSARLTLSKAF